jgi:hypothetical protein
MKYRHHGYRDDEYRQERESKKDRAERRGPREITTREATVVMRCWQCGDQQSPDEDIDALSVCKNCKAELHCCRNCRHFDPGARFQCREPVEKAFRDKTIRVDCALFEPRPVLDATGRRANSPRGGGKPGGKPESKPTSGSTGKEAFENLFK